MAPFRCSRGERHEVAVSFGRIVDCRSSGAHWRRLVAGAVGGVCFSERRAGARLEPDCHPDDRGRASTGQFRGAALQAFFHTGNLRLAISSVVTNTTRLYLDLSAVRSDVREARIISGLHLRHSMNDGDTLGTQVARWIAARY